MCVGVCVYGGRSVYYIYGDPILVLNKTDIIIIIVVVYTKDAGEKDAAVAQVTSSTNFHEYVETPVIGVPRVIHLTFFVDGGHVE